MTNFKIHCIGFASDLGGAKPGASNGPKTLRDSLYLSKLSEIGLELIWDSILNPTPSFSNKFSEIKTLSETLATSIASCVQQNKFFLVVGGDHSSAIGTWSGATQTSDLGLIWIDAHMDSHTPETSETGNIHGMPLACLLGQGETSLVKLLNRSPKLKPENVCLIGVRSFESGEANLLKNLNVRIFYMDEVKERGLKAVMQDAIELVSQNTERFGLTIDIDSIDPIDAPGTGVAEPNGILGEELCDALTLFANDARLVGFELAEFDPSRDKNHITEKLMAKLILAIAMGEVKPL